MFYKIINTKRTTFFLLSLMVPLTAYELERTEKASINPSNPQYSKWTFELWNKTREHIFVTLSYDPKDTNGIISFSLKPQKKIRSDYFTQIPFYIHIWNNASEKTPFPPTLQKKIDTGGSTAYLSYEKQGKQYNIRPQKGDQIKTKSGLLIVNNLSEHDIANIE